MAKRNRVHDTSPAAASVASLSPAQLELMDLVWSRGEIGVADAWRELAKRRSIARNTVQTMLARLLEKGWLTHRQEGNAFYYSAAQPRDRAIGGLLTRLIDTAFGGSASGLILTLLQGNALSPDEAARIRKTLDDAQARKVKGGKP